MVKQKQDNPNIKKTRSRSPEKKAQQFEKILEIGKQLFEEHGRDGFTLGGLAKKLGMNKNNFYNYIESKRELWIAIRNNCYKQYRDENREIIKESSGANLDALMSIFSHFFEFAERDFAAFRIMHIIPSPSSNKIGKFEKEYKQFSFLDGTTQLIQKAIDEGEIIEKNAALLSFFMFSLLLGSTMVEWAMRDIEDSNNKEGKKVDEFLQFGHQTFTSKEFRKYALLKIQKGLTDINLIVDESEYK